MTRRDYQDLSEEGKKVEFKVDSFVMLHTPPQQEYDVEGKRVEGGLTRLSYYYDGQDLLE